MADTKQPELSLERFGALVEAYGADLDRFPDAERVAAKALVLRSRDARRVLEVARTFDDLLESARDHASCVELEASLKRIPEQYAQRRPLLSLLPFRSVGRTSIAAAAAVLLGLLGGQLGTDAPAEDTGSAVVVDRADLASLTFADQLFEDLTEVEGSAE